MARQNYHFLPLAEKKLAMLVEEEDDDVDREKLRFD